MEPVSGHRDRAGLKENAEALNRRSVYREKKGELSHCQIWNTLMMMLLMLSDETVDLFDTQQMIHSTRTNILTEYTQICETSPAHHLCARTVQCLHALARLIKSPVSREYLDHKFCIQNKPREARNTASLFTRWGFPSSLNEPFWQLRSFSSRGLSKGQEMLLAPDNWK